jgi:hypothetical protein
VKCARRQWVWALVVCGRGCRPWAWVLDVCERGSSSVGVRRQWAYALVVCGRARRPWAWVVVTWCARRLWAWAFVASGRGRRPWAWAWALVVSGGWSSSVGVRRLDVGIVCGCGRRLWVWAVVVHGRGRSPSVGARCFVVGVDRLFVGARRPRRGSSCSWVLVLRGWRVVVVHGGIHVRVGVAFCGRWVVVCRCRVRVAGCTVCSVLRGLRLRAGGCRGFAERTLGGVVYDDGQDAAGMGVDGGGYVEGRGPRVWTEFPHAEFADILSRKEGTQ